MHLTIAAAAGALLFLAGSASCADPPVAPKRPVEIETHGDVRIDEYGWLREKESPEVIAYLESENAFARETMAHTQALEERLYDEMIARLKQTDLTVPYPDGQWMYYTRTIEGQGYRVQCRKRRAIEDAPEQVYLDENALAEGRDYLRVTSRAISPDHRLLAFALDTTGYETVDVSIKDLETGAVRADVIHDAAPWGLVWANDGRTLFYARTDEAKRTNRIYRHVLGTPESEDVLVAREDDVKFSISVRRTRSDDLILISSGSSTTDEVSFVDARHPDRPLQTIAARRPGVQYRLDHHPGPDGGTFYILTDDGAPNFRMVRTPVATPGPEHWEEVLPHDRAVYLTGVSAFRDHLVLSERRGGYTAVRVRRLADGAEHVVALPETVGTVRPGTNAEFDTSTFRFTFTSLVTPRSVFDYDLETRQRTLLKQEEVLGGYDATEYVTGRIWATAADGERVPISYVHRSGLVLDGSRPCLLTGYGSYGSPSDPGFRSTNLSFLDRGFVYAIAHVRGGSEMGRHWKEDGKMMHKRNTFTDFIACAERLIEAGYTAADRMAIRGGSAGGLLIGAVVNLRPDLFRAAHAAVPFVDVVNTMLDASIPLTTGEYEEWGNPGESAAYHYMKGYSPYDNVTAQAYPHLLVTAGLNDPRVHYWEPAKWTARLRDRKTDDNLLVLKTNMGAGHGGASGRYARYRELAFEYAFLVDRVAPERAD